MGPKMVFTCDGEPGRIRTNEAPSCLGSQPGTLPGAKGMAVPAESTAQYCLASVKAILACHLSSRVHRGCPFQAHTGTLMRILGRFVSGLQPVHCPMLLRGRPAGSEHLFRKSGRSPGNYPSSRCKWMVGKGFVSRAVHCQCQGPEPVVMGP